MKRDTAKARNIWTKHNGPIPKDEEGRSYDIHHIDGNNQNDDINNLKAVSLEEHRRIHFEQGDYAAANMIADRLGKEFYSGWQHKEETKKKIGDAHRGRKTGRPSPMKNPLIAKKVSDSLIALGDNHPCRKPERRERQREIMLDLGDDHHMKTQKSKDRQSEIWKEDNPMFNKEVVEKVMTSQTSIKSKRWKGNNPMLKEENRKIASDRMTKNNPNSKQVECPYCKLIGGYVNMRRYHFENCKNKK